MSLRGWLFRRRGREEELDEEIQSHLRMAAQQRMERGETAEGAGVSAAREFGNVTLIKEVTREMWGPLASPPFGWRVGRRFLGNVLEGHPLWRSDASQERGLHRRGGRVVGARHRG